LVPFAEVSDRVLIGSSGETVAEYRQPADRFHLRRFVLQDVPVFGKPAVFNADDVSGDPGGGAPIAGKAPVRDDIIALRDGGRETDPTGRPARNGVDPLEQLSFVLGRDHGRRWIVQETHRLCGGLFARKDAAISYARFESADRKRVIRLSPDPLELNCSS
jgi:hypothetical protein